MTAADTRAVFAAGRVDRTACDRDIAVLVVAVNAGVTAADACAVTAALCCDITAVDDDIIDAFFITAADACAAVGIL